MPDMTEDELLTGLVDALALCGWRWFHVRRSDRAIVQGHQGWPDLFAIHEGRRIAFGMELKREHGQPTTDQVGWIQALNAVGIPCGVFHPSDYDRLLEIITGKRTSLTLS